MEGRNFGEIVLRCCRLTCINRTFRITSLIWKYTYKRCVYCYMKLYCTIIFKAKSYSIALINVNSIYCTWRHNVGFNDVTRFSHPHRPRAGHEVELGEGSGGAFRGGPDVTSGGAEQQQVSAPHRKSRTHGHHHRRRTEVSRWWRQRNVYINYITVCVHVLFTWLSLKLDILSNCA